MSFELKEVINNQNYLLQSDSVRNGGVTKTVIFFLIKKKSRNSSTGTQNYKAKLFDFKMFW